MGNHFIPFVLGDLQSPSQVTSGYAIRAGHRPAAILPVDSEIHRDKTIHRKKCCDCFRSNFALSDLF